MCLQTFKKNWAELTAKKEWGEPDLWRISHDSKQLTWRVWPLREMQNFFWRTFCLRHLIVKSIVIEQKKKSCETQILCKHFFTHLADQNQLSQK